MTRAAGPTPPTDGRIGVRVVATGAVIAAVLAGWLWWGRPSGPTAAGPTVLSAVPDSSPTAAGPTGRIMVHVSGAVADPGLVEVPSGARVADAIAAAGGAVRSADVAAVNLAAPVTDGDQVVVPLSAGVAPSLADAVGEAPGEAAPGVSGLSLNRAGPAELEALPGIGPVIAARIVAHREENGLFETVEDLLDVSGIGESKLAAIRDLVVVP